MVIDTAANLR